MPAVGDWVGEVSDTLLWQAPDRAPRGARVSLDAAGRPSTDAPLAAARRASANAWVASVLHSPFIRTLPDLSSFLEQPLVLTRSIG